MFKQGPSNGRVNGTLLFRVVTAIIPESHPPAAHVGSLFGRDFLLNFELFPFLLVFSSSEPTIPIPPVCGNQVQSSSDCTSFDDLLSARLLFHLIGLWNPQGRSVASHPEPLDRSGESNSPDVDFQSSPVSELQIQSEEVRYRSIRVQTQLWRGPTPLDRTTACQGWGIEDTCILGTRSRKVGGCDLQSQLVAWDQRR